MLLFARIMFILILTIPTIVGGYSVLKFMTQDIGALKSDYMDDIDSWWSKEFCGGLQPQTAAHVACMESAWETAASPSVAIPVIFGCIGLLTGTVLIIYIRRLIKVRKAPK